MAQHAAADAAFDAGDLADARSGLAGDLQFDALADAALASKLAVVESVETSPTGEGDGLIISIMAMDSRDISKPAPGERYVEVFKPSKGTVLAAVVNQAKAIAGSQKIKALIINTHGGPGFFQWHFEDHATGKEVQENVKPKDVAPLALLAPCFASDGELIVTGCGSGSGLGGLDLGAALAAQVPGVKVYLTANSFNQVESRGDRPGPAAFRKTRSGPAVSYKTYEMDPTDKQLDVTHVWRDDHEEARWATDGYFDIYFAFVGITSVLDTEYERGFVVDAAAALAKLSTATHAFDLMDVLRTEDLYAVAKLFEPTADASTLDFGFKVLPPTGAFRQELRALMKLCTGTPQERQLASQVGAAIYQLSAQAAASLTARHATLDNQVESYYVAGKSNANAKKSK